MLLVSVQCGDPPPERLTPTPESQTWIDLTIAGISPEDRQLLITPPSDFPIDVRFPDPSEIVASSVTVSCIPWTGTGSRELTEALVRRPDGATFVLPPEGQLSPGSYTLLATASRTSGGSESVALDIAVRARSRPAPLATPQWIQLDFDADRDGDGLPDFPDDLAAFGLASGISAAIDIRVEAWVINEIVARTRAIYESPNPSGLPGGDPLALHVSSDPPDSGPYTRICVAGATPDEGSIIGNVLLDPGNSDPWDQACDDFLPSGVFPREITWYEDEPAYEAAFGPLAENPVGSNPLDFAVLGPAFDADVPEQKQRFDQLKRAVETLAQVVASVAAHEAGHAMGLVPPGNPGRGLFGGEDGALFTHNLTHEGEVPTENLLMNPGPTIRFEDLAGIGSAGPPRIRALNFAYLHGRVLLDPAIDEILMPPSITNVEPRFVGADGPPVAVLEIAGGHFRSPPALTLRGLANYAVPHTGLLPGRDGAPDMLMATLLVPGLIPGVYDVEITNPDGQRDTLIGGLEVR